MENYVKNWVVVDKTFWSNWMVSIIISLELLNHKGCYAMNQMGNESIFHGQKCVCVCWHERTKKTRAIHVPTRWKWCVRQMNSVRICIRTMYPNWIVIVSAVTDRCTHSFLFLERPISTGKINYYRTLVSSTLEALSSCHTYLTHWMSAATTSQQRERWSVQKHINKRQYVHKFGQPQNWSMTSKEWLMKNNLFMCPSPVNALSANMKSRKKKQIK